MSSKARKLQRIEFDRADIVRDARLTLPAQPVDATPSNALIRQCFPGRSDLFGCARSKPSQGSVPADLTLASDLAFVFNASRVRPECCVDPLRPPDLSSTDFLFSQSCWWWSNTRTRGSSGGLSGEWNLAVLA